MSRLRAQAAVSDDGLVTKEKFVKIPAWFDNTEASLTAVTLVAVSHSPSQMSPMSGAISNSQEDASARDLARLDASADEDDEEAGDEERLELVKSMLFDTYRIQNRQGLELNAFVGDLEFIFKDKR